MSARSIVILYAAVASAAVAAPSIDPQFGDHAVIQRGKPVTLSGTASPGEPLTVVFAGLSRSTKADAAGRWRASFPTRASGRGLAIQVRGANGMRATASDIAIGDVWLCSGQSNMEYPLRRALNGDGEVQSAKDDDLRLLKIDKQLSDSAQASFAKPPRWQRSSPDSAKDFSAACIFMARDLRKTIKVPIGAIDATWGGTPIRAWMDEESARASGNAEAAALLDAFRANPDAALRRFGASWQQWWRGRTGDKAGREPWAAPGILAWKGVPSIGNWNEWGGDWPDYDGAIWARRQLTLTAAQAAQPATLSLGVIDDIDQTFVNGVPVGGSSDPVTPRHYRIPAGTLHAGPNEIIVYVRDLWGPGGMMGPADALRLQLADGTAIPVGTGWQYARIDDSIGSPPVPPWGNSSGVSTIYNAMVAPLGGLGLKGVAWYQGEADVGQNGYDRRLAAWMTSWRTQFGDPSLPFLIVGLAGWGKPVSHPVESGWAATINEQRLAVAKDAHAALASAIDLGEPDDIHPANKQEVGRRLALAARAIAYPGGSGMIGPLPLAATQSGRDVIVRFTKPLQTLSSATATSFELCGPVTGTCRYALARVEGNSVHLTGDGQAVARVRYAWADYPVVNLYDRDMLPAPVFEMPVQ